MTDTPQKPQITDATERVPAPVDRRPIHFIANLSMPELRTPENPAGLHPEWLLGNWGWLMARVDEEAERAMFARPAGSIGNFVPWAHWHTLTPDQQWAMRRAAKWQREYGVKLGLYVGRLISPPDTLDPNAHVICQNTEEHRAWVRESLMPYVDMGFTEFGFDAASGLDWQDWLTLHHVVRDVVGPDARIFIEAIPHVYPGYNRWARMCNLEYLIPPGPDRLNDPAWSFPKSTEVHCLLTAAQAEVEGRVQLLESKGYIVSCRNIWWR